MILPKALAATLLHAAVCVALLVLVRTPLLVIGGICVSALVAYLAVSLGTTHHAAPPPGLGRLGDKLAGYQTFSSNSHFRVAPDGSDFAGSTSMVRQLVNAHVGVAAISILAALLALLLAQ